MRSKSQHVVVDDTAVLAGVEVEVKRSVMVPMLDGDELIGNLAVFSFEDQVGLDDNIRFFFDIGVAAARALRRPWRAARGSSPIRATIRGGADLSRLQG